MPAPSSRVPAAIPIAALLLASSLLATRTLAAQGSAPAADAASAPPAFPGASPAAVYPLAWRRLARQSCQLGIPDALESALRDTRATMSTLDAAERAPAERTLDSAYAAAVRDGGCRVLARPARVVIVDAFEGHPWGAPLADVGSARDGTYGDDGFLVLSRDTRVAGGKGEAVYTFTAVPGRERLVRGRWRLPVKHRERCGRRWLAVEGAVLAAHPALRVARPSAPPDERASCDDDAGWLTTFRNARTSALEARMSLARDARGRTTIIVDFPGLELR
ncbi:MAG TPA: hypothetical protein VF041_08295 [Gemmatimonadaceae bacterium]